MADEIRITSLITHNDGSASATTGTTTVDVDVETTITSQKHILNVQNVGTSREAIVTGDVDTSKDYFVRFKNLDDTNFVKIETYDSTNYVYGFNIEPGETFGPARVDGGKTVHLTADTAACSVEVFACDAGDPAV